MSVMTQNPFWAQWDNLFAQMKWTAAAGGLLCNL